MPTLYVTTNQDKFQKAVQNLSSFGINLKQRNLELHELQLLKGDQVAQDKARQAFEQLQQPVLVNDDTWSVEALGGFPSTAMKMCNHYLQADDWLRLMQGVKNRTIWLISYYVYFDGRSYQTVVSKNKCFFLEQSQGSHPHAPVLEVVARFGEQTSLAQNIAAKEFEEKDQQDFWQKLATVLKQ